VSLYECLCVCVFGVDGWIFGCTNAVKTTSARMLANLSHLCTARWNNFEGDTPEIWLCVYVCVCVCVCVCVFVRVCISKGILKKIPSC